jgi:hypothetical protein
VQFHLERVNYSQSSLFLKSRASALSTSASFVFSLCFQILSLFFYVFSLVLCYPAHDRLPFASELVTIFSSKFDVSLLLLTESLLYMLLLLVTGYARNCQCFPYLKLCCSSFHCWCSLFLFLQFSVTISCWKICYPQ